MFVAAKAFHRPSAEHLEREGKKSVDTKGKSEMLPFLLVFIRDLSNVQPLNGRKLNIVKAQMQLLANHL